MFSVEEIRNELRERYMRDKAKDSEVFDLDYCSRIGFGCVAGDKEELVHVELFGTIISVCHLCDVKSATICLDTKNDCIFLDGVPLWFNSVPVTLSLHEDSGLTVEFNDVATFVDYLLHNN